MLLLPVPSSTSCKSRSSLRSSSSRTLGLIADGDVSRRRVKYLPACWGKRQRLLSPRRYADMKLAVKSAEAQPATVTMVVLR
jgi:hypothetical protein